METIEKAIIKTLSFFDLFFYPLTKEEIFSYLWQIKSDQDLVFKTTAELLDKKVIEEKNGYYFLLGKEQNCEVRKNSLLESELKLKIAHKAVKKISVVPFVKAIFVCNSVAFGLAKKESDVDLFIVTAKKRIWIVRFFTNLILLLFRLRRINQKSVSNRICLSFYVDEENLDLKNVRAVPEDILFAYWLATFLPIYDPDKLGEKILLANTWLKNILPNLPRNLSSYIKEIKNGPVKKSLKFVLQKMWGGSYGDLIERQAKETQLAKMKFSLEDFKNKEPNVVVNDTMLKFHESDNRKEYYDKWRERVENLKYE
ncbi:MAG: hypothetical protein Q7J14_00350 [Candidatus Magasanikbacteria bacterium]|nr:hypothetical protein [Candidatus Magasanikbacteria bacterium]